MGRSVQEYHPLSRTLRTDKCRNTLPEKWSGSPSHAPIQKAKASLSDNAKRLNKILVNNPLSSYSEVNTLIIRVLPLHIY